jgi:hypothetical protein
MLAVRGDGVIVAVLLVVESLVIASGKSDNMEWIAADRVAAYMV